MGWLWTPEDTERLLRKLHIVLKLLEETEKEAEKSPFPIENELKRIYRELREIIGFVAAGEVSACLGSLRSTGSGP